MEYRLLRWIYLYIEKNFGKILSAAFMNKEIKNRNFFLYIENSRTRIDIFGYRNNVEREENIIKMEY